MLEPKPGSEKSQPLKAGKRWQQGPPDHSPSEEAEQLPGWEGGFHLAGVQGLGVAAYSCPVYWVSAALCVCDAEELQFLTPGRGKMSSLMWLMHEPHVLP